MMSMSRQHPGTSWAWEDIHATDKGYEIEVPVPGMRKEDVQVTVLQRTLSIHAEKKTHDKKRLRVSRCFLLPPDADVSTAHAVVEDGLLRITLNRSDLRSVKHIVVH